MSWQNELKSEIVFRAPSSLGADSSISGKIKSAVTSVANQYNPLSKGQSGEYRAKWRGDKRSFERKLGQFDSPHGKGTTTQDLGPKSKLWPITAYFDGINHHKDARNFYDALFDEPGQWEVVHPVHGPLILQLISAEEDSNPVEYGNYTIINMQWIEPANQERMVSTTEIFLEIVQKIQTIAEDLQTALADLRTGLFSFVTSGLGMFNKISGFLNKTLKSLAATSAMARDAFEEARASFDGAKSMFKYDDPDTTDMSAALTNMALAPADASTDYEDRQTAYAAYADYLFTVAPTGTSEEDRNAAIVLEFGATLAIIAAAKVAATSQYKSRAEVVQAIDSVTAFFNSVVARIEAIQELYKGLTLDKQYFSQTSTYHDLTRLYTLVFEYLIAQLYSVKIERKIMLTRARSPLEIAITEYQPSAGEIDCYYSLFLESNNLHGNDIILLPAGRTVKVYR